MRRALLPLATLASLVALPSRAAAQPTGSDPLRAADSAWSAGDNAAARVAYDAVLRADSAHPRALVRRATLDAWDGRFGDAVALYRRALRASPADAETRVALARALAWAGRYDESVALDDSVRARDPESRDAALDAAQTLSWAGRFRDAETRYRAWVAAHPGDHDSELALARTLSWAGRLREAGAIYARLAAAGSADARKGAARVAAWRGDVRASVSQWEALARDLPRDAEVWGGLAQALRWQGRPRAARAALAVALRERPGDRDAVAQLRWVDAELATSAAPTVTYATDSDRNTTLTATASLALPPSRDVRLSLLALSRSATLPGTDARSHALRAAFAWSSTAGLSLAGDLGASHGRATSGGTVASFVRPLGSLRASLALPRGASLEASAARAPFAETAALIRSAIATTSGELALSVPVGARLTASASASRARLGGGSGPNARASSSAALRWAPTRSLALALSRRAFAYDRGSRDGYFAPRRFSLLEASARAGVGGELGWRAEAEGGFGRQTIALAGDPGTHGAARGSLSVAFRPRPGSELTLAAGAANVAPPNGAVGGSAYRAHSLTLRARLPVR